MTAPDWLDAAVLAIFGLLAVIGLLGYVVAFVIIKRKLRDWMPMEVWIVVVILLSLYSLAVLQ